MLKSFLMKKMMKSQMKGVPEDQQEMAMEMIEKNPELFQKIGLEIQEEMKKGGNQMAVAMKIMKKYQSELQGIKK